MPHLYIEYTDNIKNEADIHELLEKANKTLLSHSDIIPAGGLSSRPFVLEDYLVADRTEDDAFVHVTLKMAPGRTEEQKKAVCDDLFQTIKGHFVHIFEKRYIALSMELCEFQNETYKHSNIHGKYDSE